MTLKKYATTSILLAFFNFSKFQHSNFDLIDLI